MATIPRFPLALAAVLASLLLGAPPAMANYEAGVAALYRGDYPAAREAWRAPAAEGDRRAQFWLGRLLVAGGDLEGLALIEKSAKAGYLPAELHMALYRLHGLYMPQELSAWFAWLRRVDGHGKEEGARHPKELATGHLLLSLIAREGRFVPKSPEQSAYYLRKAADAGDPTAQFHHAENLEKGNGLTQDLVEAHKFYVLSWKQEHEGARERALALRRRMSPADFATSRRRVCAWLAAKDAGTLGQAFLIEQRTPAGLRTLERQESLHIRIARDVIAVDCRQNSTSEAPWLRSRVAVDSDAQMVTAERWTVASGTSQRHYRVALRLGPERNGEETVLWDVSREGAPPQPGAPPR